MMLYGNRFNVYMSYHDGGEGGGSSPGGPGLGAPSVGEELGFTVTDSQYKFTDPPRYYKANDPYYYEVDNIPIKQIHENCLWLRDQISGAASDLTDISTRQIRDLKPTVTEQDRLVRVLPGRFIGRVNTVSIISQSGDNIATISLPQYSVDISRHSIYSPHGTEIQESAWKVIVGEVVGAYVAGVGSNGLFDHYQHHQVGWPGVEGSSWVLDWVPEGYMFTDLGAITIDTLSKIQTAVWQQRSAVEETYQPYDPDFRQLSTDFCRKWGGVFRTSVVNVEETLAIQVPAWSDDDFMDNNTVYDAQVRIDLVFVYTKPVDSIADVSVTEKEGSQLRTISSPALGLVKGAGGILSARNGALDIVADPSLIGTQAWDVQAAVDGGVRDKYYDTSGGTDAGVSIASPMSNQSEGTVHPIPQAPTYSFPSPDDLMNMAPLIADNYLGSDFAGIGQSVLPLCYVIVKKGSTVILDEDIIDIRPFLRTAELTYNERAGLGASNPPLSLANPAVGKAELYKTAQELRNYLVDEYELGFDPGTGPTNLVPRVCTLYFDAVDLGKDPNNTGLYQYQHRFKMTQTGLFNNNIDSANPLWGYNNGEVFEDKGNDIITSFTLVKGTYKVETNAMAVDFSFGAVKINNNNAGVYLLPPLKGLYAGLEQVVTDTDIPIGFGGILPGLNAFSVLGGATALGQGPPGFFPDSAIYEDVHYKATPRGINFSYIVKVTSTSAPAKVEARVWGGDDFVPINGDWYLGGTEVIPARLRIWGSVTLTRLPDADLG